MHVFIALWSLPVSTILEKVYTHESESVKLISDLSAAVSKPYN